MSALGQKQTCAAQQPMSAFPPKATSNATYGSALGQKADIAPLIRSPSAVVRPLTREPCWRSTVRDLAAVEGALAHLSQFNILRATVALVLPLNYVSAFPGQPRRK